MSGCETNWPAPCPMCGEGVEASKEYVWGVSCPNCYDGAPDAGRQLIAFGVRRDETVNDWNEQVAEYEADRDDARRELEEDRRIDEARGK